MITFTSPRVRLSIAIVFIVLLSTFARQPQVANGQNVDVPVDAETVESLMQDAPPAAKPTAAAGQSPVGLDLWSLMIRGGIFMIPIGLMSLLVVTLVIERFLSLRRKRVIPKALTRELERMSNPVDRFNPAVALEVCRDNPSPAATVIEAMLRRTGQPLAEIERAATDTIQREADDYAAPIRWLSLAVAATPLMGLLGTVWGMIIAFHDSTTLTADRNRSEQLSEGIYTALVTTLAGLIVAIPAAICAQYLENRLIKLFHRIERFTFEFAPNLARFAGRMRLDADGALRSMNASTPAVTTATSSVPAPPPAPPVGVGAKAERVKR